MKSIVFCSSQRFKKDLEAFTAELRRLSEEKNIHLTVLHPNFGEAEERLGSLHERERLKDRAYREDIAGKVYDHLFRKVRVADVCYIFNKDGYLGVNTSGELFAAAISGKLCYAHEDRFLMGHYPHDLYEEPSCRKLVHEVVATPGELLKRLA